MKRDRQKSTHLRVRRLPPADLGDGRDDPARQQAAAHRLVLGRLPDGDPLQRHLCPELQKRSVSALTAALGCSPTSCAPAWSTPSATRCRAWWKSTRPAFHSGTGGQGRSHDGKMLIVGAIELGDSQAACGWPKSAPPTSDTSSKPPPSAKPTAGPATLRSPPIATMFHVAGRPPLTSSCRGSTASLRPTSKDGRGRQSTGKLRRKHLQAYLDEFVFRFNRRKTRHAAFRSLFRLATNAEPLTYSMLIEPEPCA